MWQTIQMLPEAVQGELISGIMVMDSLAENNRNAANSFSIVELTSCSYYSWSYSKTRDR
jgi:hypothetical protein